MCGTASETSSSANSLKMSLSFICISSYKIWNWICNSFEIILYHILQYSTRLNRKYSENKTFKCLISLLELIKMSQKLKKVHVKEIIPLTRDSEWAGLRLSNLQIHTDEWQQQLETIQALANSKVGFACYSCAVAFSHNLPLQRSLARSRSPTRFTLTPTTLSFTRTLSLALRSHLSFTYLMSFNWDSLVLAMPLSKCQVNASLQTF